MTRQRTYVLTGISVALFAFLSWAFADEQFTGTFWNSKAIMESSIWTYVFLGLIVLAGLYQARSLPAEGVATTTGVEDRAQGQTDDPRTWKLLMGNVFVSHRLAADPLLRGPRVGGGRRAQAA